MILIVDDDPQIGDLLREVLEPHGYTILLARSGGEAVKIWKRERTRIQLILTDVMMPGMDGPETVVNLARRGAVVPVLYMSAYPRENIPHQDPHTAFVQKPFSFGELLAQVRLLLGDPADPDAPVFLPDPPPEPGADE